MSTGGTIGVPIDSGELSLSTLTKEIILDRVNQITRREETSIDTLLYAVLTDITERTLCLKTQTGGTLSAGDASVSKPDDMAPGAVFSLVVDGDDLPPLTWHEYINQTRRGYIDRQNTLAFYPAVNADTTYTLYYARLHPADMDHILLPDRFTSAIVYGTASKLYENYELNEHADRMRIHYELELRRLAGYEHTAPTVRPLPMRL